MIKGSKAWHEVTAIVTNFFDNLNTSKYNYMGFLRSIDRIKYDSGVCIAIFEKIASRTSKESIINEKIKLEIIEYCNENIIFLKDSKIDDKGFRAMNDFSNFGKSYLNDLEYCKSQYGPAYTEIDFLLEQIKDAKDILDNKELCEITKENKTIEAPYNNEEKALFKQRIFKFENRITEIKSILDYDAIFSALNKNQNFLSDSDVKEIIESISEFIKTKFEYFDLNYKNNDFTDLLIDLFTHTTKAFQDISDANTANIPAKKLAYANINKSKKLIKEKLLEFRNFYRYIQEKSTNDSNRLLLVFTTIFEKYESICNLYGYNLKKSYCYDTINEFYNELIVEFDSVKIIDFDGNSEKKIKEKFEDPISSINKIEKTSNDEIFVLTENNFNSLEPKEIEIFFRNEFKNICDENTINLFLVSAFIKRKAPKNKFKFTECEKEKIMNIFHRLYLKSHKPKGKALEYGSLLSDYFSEFGVSSYVCSNWHRYKYKKGRKK